MVLIAGKSMMVVNGYGLVMRGEQGEIAMN